MALADFHLHSTASDGTMPPSEVVALAARNGAHVIALTDHDTVAGIPEAAEAARRLGLRLVPGIELSTDLGPHDVHIIALGIDPRNPELLAFLAEQREHRVRRAYRIVEALAAHGVQLDPARLFEIAGEASVGRPHVARALMERGYVASVQEAFDRWLGTGKPGDIPRPKLPPEEAIRRVHAWGGVAIAAHPLFVGEEYRSVLEALVAARVDGIEVYYRDYPAEVVYELEAFAEAHGLAKSGGSDFHGLDRPGECPPASMQFPERAVQEFLSLLERRALAY